MLTIPRVFLYAMLILMLITHPFAVVTMGSVWVCVILIEEDMKLDADPMPEYKHSVDGDLHASGIRK